MAPQHQHGASWNERKMARICRRVRRSTVLLAVSFATMAEVSSLFVRHIPNRCNSARLDSIKSSPPRCFTSTLFATLTNSTTDTASPPAFQRHHSNLQPIRKSATKVIYTRGKDISQRQFSNSQVETTKQPEPFKSNSSTGTVPHSSATIHRPDKTNTSTSQHLANSKKNVQSPNKKTPQHDEFQWLNWVYYQWKDKAPGQLTDENVVRQMIAAIPHWARRRSLAAAKRAEELLERLVQEALAGNTLLTGTTTTSPLLSVSEFNAAMDAYGKIGNPQGVQRLLRRMESLQKASQDGGDVDFAQGLRPDAFSMSILATAWAKSGSPDAAQKADAILQYMDLNGLKANTVTYNAILNAIAVGNQVDKALRAEDVVEQMKDRHEQGQDCAPDVYTYQSLIQAWSKTTLPGAPQKAEEILRYMDEASERNEKLTPNAYCFTTVIHCWARSSEKKRARSAYNLLNTLTRRYQEALNAGKRAKHLRPNVKTFTAVLNACARPSDAIEALDAFAIAKLTMAELSLGVYGEPNFLSYAAFLSVCATTLDAGPKRDSIVKQTFKSCVQAGQVGTIVLEKLSAAASLELMTELIGSYRGDTGEIQVPKEWKANVKDEKASSFFMPTPKVTEQDVRKVSKSSQRRFEAVQRFEGQCGSMSFDMDYEIIWRNGSF